MESFFGKILFFLKYSWQEISKLRLNFENIQNSLLSLSSICLGLGIIILIIQLIRNNKKNIPAFLRIVAFIETFGLTAITAVLLTIGPFAFTEDDFGLIENTGDFYMIVAIFISFIAVLPFLVALFLNKIFDKVFKNLLTSNFNFEYYIKYDLFRLTAYVVLLILYIKSKRNYFISLFEPPTTNIYIINDVFTEAFLTFVIFDTILACGISYYQKVKSSKQNK